ncbi:MAG TPA: MOSC domain-containing protein [Streptosporangiaceae bacterium]|jgi:hypothetical protein
MVVVGDRRWAFIRDGQVHNGFPWLTIRQRPELAHYRPRFAEPDRPDASTVLVRTPGGDELDVADPALAGLGRLAGADLTAGRFRPNLLVDARGPGFPEDAWVGRVLRIGGLRMRVDQRDKRCVVVTIDPVTLDRDPAILRAIARDREARFGVYGSAVEPGRIRVGDRVELEPESVAFAAMTG